MWGATGVSTCTRARGETIGPRADRLYAVEPVGVARINESEANVRNGSELTATSVCIVWPTSVRCRTTSLRALRGGAGESSPAAPWKLTSRVIRGSTP